MREPRHLFAEGRNAWSMACVYCGIASTSPAAKHGCTHPSAFLSLSYHVPDTYGEAVELYPFVREFPSHEYDNRTQDENAAWLLGQMRTRLFEGRE